MNRQRVHEIVELARPGDRASALFDSFILWLIVINLTAFVMETDAGLKSRFDAVFKSIEVISLTVFVIEYAARIWSCTADPAYRHPVRGRLAYMLQPMMLLDLLAILPGLLFWVDLDGRVLRAFRLFRFFRLARASQYSESVRLLRDTLLAKRADLLVALSALLILLLVASTAMYYLERDAQPANFRSIPAAMWWGVTTLTTVGYGDVIPATAFGRLVGGVIAVLGVGLFALPAGIIASGFSDAMNRRRQARGICPTCHRPLESSHSHTDA